SVIVCAVIGDFEKKSLRIDCFHRFTAKIVF
ncbi:MAG: hypothetical protein ACI9O4_000256, partial [Chitinophagales bacterium]